MIQGLGLGFRVQDYLFTMLALDYIHNAIDGPEIHGIGFLFVRLVSRQSLTIFTWERERERKILDVTYNG